MKIKLEILGNTPLVEKQNIFGIETLYIKDETNNPTYTFKDRLSHEMLKPIIDKINNGKEITKTTFCSISYGNTALSMGYYCNMLNEMYGQEIVNAIAIIPPYLYSKTFGPDTKGNTHKASRIFKEIEKYCSIIELDLEKQYYTSKDLEKIVRDKNLCLDEFVNITEGLNRPSYEGVISEVIEKQLSKTPDYIIVPFGAGILCNEIMDYIKENNINTKVIPVSSGNPDTIAIMLYGPIWIDTKKLQKDGQALSFHSGFDLKGKLREPYTVYNVDDSEILAVLNKLDNIGVSCEPSAASGFAVLHRLTKIDSLFNPQKHSVLVINTGNSFLNFKNKNTEKKYKNNLELTPVLEKYILQSNNMTSPNLNKLREIHSNIDDDILQITSVQAYLISFLVKLINAKSTLDIGTYKGYSALTVALATSPESKTITCDNNGTYGKIAKDFWRKYNVDNKIELIIDDALKVLKDLIDKGFESSFDFIFIDADKTNYVLYYELALILLKKGGLMAIDNTLFFGTVVGNRINDNYLKQFVSKVSTNTIIKLNKLISKDSRVDKCLLPIADGFTLITKK